LHSQSVGFKEVSLCLVNEKKKKKSYSGGPAEDFMAIFNGNDSVSITKVVNRASEENDIAYIC
jgi:hypothetical protein